MPKKEYLRFDFDDIAFRAIAIHTALPPALLAWQIDRFLGTKFSILPFSFSLMTKKSTSEHAQYYFRDEEFDTEWWILENQGTQESLMQVKPLPDMILIGRGGEDDNASEIWLEKLKSIPGISLSYEVADKVKKKLTWITWLSDKKVKDPDQDQEKE
ncbi:MAG: hypothetical protein ACK5FT_10700 [Sphingomonadales bacterium]|jgi:hypothetical protein